MKAILVMMAFAVVLSYLSIYSLMVHHEMAHADIFKYYGCTDIEIQHHLTHGSTVCHDYEGIVNYEDMKFLHAQNEIAGYHAISIIGALFNACFLIIIIIFILGEENDKRKHQTGIHKRQSESAI